MNMGAAGTFKHPGNEDFFIPKAGAADRANPVPFAVKAVNTAPYMHEPILSPGKRRKSRGFYQFARGQFGGTYRTGLRSARVAFAGGLPPAPPPESAAGGYADSAYKQGIAKPEQDGSYDGKS
jgi:hypothetical protein